MLGMQFRNGTATKKKIWVRVMKMRVLLVKMRKTRNYWCVENAEVIII